MQGIVSTFYSGGPYICFPNGFMIQWGSNNVGSAPSNALYDFAINFTKPFIAKPVVVASLADKSYTPSKEMSGPNIKGTDISNFSGRVYNAYTGSLVIIIDWIAIGRWK